MRRKPYPSDMTDEQWALIEPLLPRASRRHRRGRPRQTELREVVNALFYHTREGCTWRALPHDLPPWKTVYNYFQGWDRDGTWQKLLDTLRPLARVKAGRAPTPSAAAIDSQSVKSPRGQGTGHGRGQEGQGPQASYPRRFPGFSHRRGGDGGERRRCPGSPTPLR